MRSAFVIEQHNMLTCRVPLEFTYVMTAKPVLLIASVNIGL